MQRRGPALTPCYQGLRCRQRPKLRAVPPTSRGASDVGGERPREGWPLPAAGSWGAPGPLPAAGPADGPGSGRPAVRGGPHQGPPHTSGALTNSPSHHPDTPPLFSEERGAHDHAAAHIGVGRDSAAAAAKGPRPWMREEMP